MGGSTQGLNDTPESGHRRERPGVRVDSGCPSRGRVGTDRGRVRPTRGLLPSRPDSVRLGALTVTDPRGRVCLLSPRRQEVGVGLID